MKLMIQVDDKGIISDVKFKTFGCGSAIASSSYMTERVRGLTLDEASAIKNTEIAKECVYSLGPRGRGSLELPARSGPSRSSLPCTDARAHHSYRLSLPPVKLHCSMLA